MWELAARNCFFATRGRTLLHASGDKASPREFAARHPPVSTGGTRRCGQGCCLLRCSGGRTQILRIDSSSLKFSTSFAVRLLQLSAGFHEAGRERFAAAASLLLPAECCPDSIPLSICPVSMTLDFSLVRRALLSSWKASSKDYAWQVADI